MVVENNKGSLLLLLQTSKYNKPLNTELGWTKKMVLEICQKEKHSTQSTLLEGNDAPLTAIYAWEFVVVYNNDSFLSQPWNTNNYIYWTYTIFIFPKYDMMMTMGYVYV